MLVDRAGGNAGFSFEVEAFSFCQNGDIPGFFRQRLPLVLLEKYTYETGETLKADIQAANFGKIDICVEVHYEQKGKDVMIDRIPPKAHCPLGKSTLAGKLEILQNRSGWRAYKSKHLESESNGESKQ